MTDILTPSQRQYCMSRIKGKDTKPELILRRALHVLGYRYRLHYPGLPGRPDLVFPSRRKVIFVHCCYWHRHNCRLGNATPATRKQFWLAKFARNRARDQEVRRALKKLGWGVLVVWECQLARIPQVLNRVKFFLEGSPKDCGGKNPGEGGITP